MGIRRLGDVLRRALSHYLAAGGAGFGAEVNHPVGALDHVEVVLDHDHGVPGVDQAVEDLDEDADVVEVEAGGGLVEDVELAALTLASVGQLARDLEPLRLAAGERSGGLAETQIAEAD